MHGCVIDARIAQTRLVMKLFLALTRRGRPAGFRAFCRQALLAIAIVPILVAIDAGPRPAHPARLAERTGREPRGRTGSARLIGPGGRIGQADGSSGPALAWGRQTVLARACGPLRAATSSDSRQSDPRGGQLLRSHPTRPPGPAHLPNSVGSITQLATASPLHDRPVTSGSPERIYLWVIRDALEDTVAFAAIADTARALGCTDLLVQVRGRGEAYYRSATEPAPRYLETPCPDGVRRGERPSEEALPFDPLAAACRIAQARGLRIHAWFNVFLTGGWSRNAARNAIVLHPEWAALLRDGRSPGDLAAGDRLRSRIEGIYMSPGNAEVLPYLRRVVRELLTRYPLDGLHLDYIRYPYADAGYDPASREAFLIADLEESIPQAADTTLALWDRWRIAQVSRAVEELARTARSARPGIEVTAAVIPDPRIARRDCKQDWPRWLSEGWIDAALPMAYTTSTERFEAWLRAADDLDAGSGRIVPGLGLHKLDAEALGRELRLLAAGGSRPFAIFSHAELMAKRSLREAIRGNGGVR